MSTLNFFAKNDEILFQLRTVVVLLSPYYYKIVFLSPYYINTDYSEWFHPTLSHQAHFNHFV